MEEIVRYAVYPCLGIARVGNSEDEYFVGPEAPGQPPRADGGFKDERGRVKRQAARFRVYGLDESGRAVREITAGEAEITWRVHLANRKASWYQFNNAMDLGEYGLEARYRNQDVLGEDRRTLTIDPGPRSISGRGASGVTFDGGQFMGIEVQLGELRTDEEGRLLVLGGFGHSASKGNAPATTFANNDGWHDDVSDGPVRATVKVGGEVFEAEPAMVAVTPPNYAPGLYGVVTMYDVVYDLFCREFAGEPGWAEEAARRPTFWGDIYPLFERLVNSQWVNGGVDFLFGTFSPSNLTSPGLLKILADPSAASAEARHALFKWFRDPADNKGPEEDARIPPFYGDAFGDFTQVGMDELALTPTQYGRMARWADGDFDPDPKFRERPASLEDYPVAGQPRALDEAHLESCLGGPFHPGIELTWTLRQRIMWKEPFRLNVLPEGEEPRDDFGPILTPGVALGADGPHTASGPGTLTRWMGVPWQTDEASCLSGYDIATYLRLPSFWAARVPNQVLSTLAYQRVLDASLPLGQRLKHFNYRQDWMRYFGPSYQTRINQNVAMWHKVGVVVEQPGPYDHEQNGLPDRVWVETGLAPEFSEGDPTWTQILMAEGADTPRRAQAAAMEVGEERAGIPVRKRRRVFRRDEL
ncbi:MAG TPA: LodA/GoxA family CTQ-dependent oxidase [Pyrinomonadaceae bacterium]|jgi:hypothetical protein